MEINPAPLEYARAAYAAPNLRFEQGGAQAIPLPDQSIDCVVSLETIERFSEHEQYLAEIRRVLRPGGKLVISLPDRDAYSPPASAPSPYHVRELTRNEFAALLESNFAHVVLLGQYPIVGSVIVSTSGTGNAFDTLTFERPSGHRFEASSRLNRAQYWVAIASDAALPPLPESIYFDAGTIDDVMVALPALHLEHQRFQTQLTQSKSDLSLAKKNIRELYARLQRLNDSIAELDNSIAEKDAESAEYLYHLNRINSSPWWRLGMWFAGLIHAAGSFFASRSTKHQLTGKLIAQVSERVALEPETITLPVPSPNPEASVVAAAYGLLQSSQSMNAPCASSRRRVLSFGPGTLASISSRAQRAT